MDEVGIMDYVKMLERYELQDETIMTFGAFSILWCQYEQAYFESNFNYKDLEKWVSSLECTKNIGFWYERIREETKQYMGYVNADSIQNRIFSVKNKGKPTYRDSIEKFLDGSEFCLIGCFLYIKRIRDNMFHGLKSVYSLDNQRSMINAICGMLNEVLENDHY